MSSGITRDMTKTSPSAAVPSPILKSKDALKLRVFDRLIQEQEPELIVEWFCEDNLTLGRIVVDGTHQHPVGGRKRPAEVLGQ